MSETCEHCDWCEKQEDRIGLCKNGDAFPKQCSRICCDGSPYPRIWLSFPACLRFRLRESPATRAAKRIIPWVLRWKEETCIGSVAGVIQEEYAKEKGV